MAIRCGRRDVWSFGYRQCTEPNPPLSYCSFPILQFHCVIILLNFPGSHLFHLVVQPFANCLLTFLICSNAHTFSRFNFTGQLILFPLLNIIPYFQYLHNSYIYFKSISSLVSTNVLCSSEYYRRITLFFSIVMSRVL